MKGFTFIGIILNINKKYFLIPIDIVSQVLSSFSIHPSTGSQETAFLVIYINGKNNHNGGMKAIKRAPNSSHAPCFLPTPFGLRTNILLRTNGER
ncbi:MAG: hypothetical protein WC091_04170 [Sulfuricellaceae bacterium]